MSSKPTEAPKGDKATSQQSAEGEQANAEQVAEQPTERKPPEPPKTKDGKEFPVSGLKAIIAELRRPFTSAAVGFLPADEKDGRIVALTFINGTSASERLNLVCPEDWSEAFEEADDHKHLVCKLTVSDATHIDVGTSADGGVKAMYSDARKRAAVHFGIGAYLRGLPRWYLDSGEVVRDGKRSATITDAGLKRLHDEYEKWLQEVGIPRYGDVLDHGDSPEDYDALAQQADEAAEREATDAEQSGVMKVELTKMVRDYVKVAGPDGLTPFMEALFDLGINPEKEDHGDDPAAWATSLSATPGMKLYAWLTRRISAINAAAKAQAEQAAGGAQQPQAGQQGPHLTVAGRPPQGKMAVPIPHGAGAPTEAPQEQAQDGDPQAQVQTEDAPHEAQPEGPQTADGEAPKGAGEQVAAGQAPDGETPEAAS